MARAASCRSLRSTSATCDPRSERRRTISTDTGLSSRPIGTITTRLISLARIPPISSSAGVTSGYDLGGCASTGTDRGGEADRGRARPKGRGAAGANRLRGDAKTARSDDAMKRMPPTPPRSANVRTNFGHRDRACHGGLRRFRGGGGFDGATGSGGMTVSGAGTGVDRTDASRAARRASSVRRAAATAASASARAPTVRSLAVAAAASRAATSSARTASLRSARAGAGRRSQGDRAPVQLGVEIGKAQAHRRHSRMPSRSVRDSSATGRGRGIATGLGVTPVPIRRSHEGSQEHRPATPMAGRAQSAPSRRARGGGSKPCDTAGRWDGSHFVRRPAAASPIAPAHRQAPCGPTRRMHPALRAAHCAAPARLVEAARARFATGGGSEGASRRRRGRAGGHRRSDRRAPALGFGRHRRCGLRPRSSAPSARRCAPASGRRFAV